MNQTQTRLYTANTGSPSLRRSLLLAARTPQVPPSPSTCRRSTLTQPTQSSAAKSAPSRNLKQNVSKTEKKLPVRNVPQTSRPVSAKRNVAAPPPKNTQQPTVVKKTTPLTVRKVDRSASPKPKEMSKKVSSPKTQIKKMDSPVHPRKVDNIIQSKKVTSPSQSKKVDSPKKNPVTRPIQRSDTFLKEEPTVLQKM